MPLSDISIVAMAKRKKIVIKRNREKKKESCNGEQRKTFWDELADVFRHFKKCYVFEDVETICITDHKVPRRVTFMSKIPGGMVMGIWVLDSDETKRASSS